MKIKALIYTSIALLAAVFAACDDDMGTVGNSIRPNPDDILVEVDTIFNIKAATVAMDSVYARTTYGLIGEYKDPIFGTIKSDYLCELYCPDTMSFLGGNRKDLISIDSVQFNIGFASFWGDSISPMGMSVYEVNNPLERNYYTNVDPSKYCSMDKPLGQGVFSIQNIPTLPSGIRILSTPVKKEVGDFFLDKWKNNPEYFNNSDSLRKIFPGLYITTTMGSGTLVNVEYSMLDISYKYQGKNSAGTADSIRSGLFRLAVTSEVIQLNHVENKSNDLIGPSNGKSYIKSPAGLCTELTIPLSEILERAGTDRVLNSAKFKLAGISEDEEKSGFSRPAYLLMIHKDSIESYFENKLKPNGKTSLVITNSSLSSSSTSFNTYDMGNIASLINHYADLYKEQGVAVADIPDLKYRLIPVDITTVTTSTGNVIDRTYNTMLPKLAVLRTDAESLKIPLILSKYNTQK